MQSLSVPLAQPTLPPTDHAKQQPYNSSFHNNNFDNTSPLNEPKEENDTDNSSDISESQSIDITLINILEDIWFLEVAIFDQLAKPIFQPPLSPGFASSENG